jgi:hypothetical protein
MMCRTELIKAISNRNESLRNLRDTIKTNRLQAKLQLDANEVKKSDTLCPSCSSMNEKEMGILASTMRCRQAKSISLIKCTMGGVDDQIIATSLAPRPPVTRQ